jgi:hypothetical protein
VLQCVRLRLLLTWNMSVSARNPPLLLQLIVYKMKPKKHYRRKTGHRQELTKFMVTKISA